MPFKDQQLSRESLEPRRQWAPDTGDYVVGTVDRITGHSGKTRDGRQYKPYWLCGLNLGSQRALRVWGEGGPVVEQLQRVNVAVRGEVLCNEFSRANPEVGDEIAILYRGRRQGAVNEYHDWTVAKQGGLTKVAWDRAPDEPTPALPASSIPADAAGLPAAGELYKPLPSQDEPVVDATVDGDDDPPPF